ncbi:hypothetical protein GALL_470380 [mine drainage metagenome]|uniref:Uncharacterized protein n=1 Tax=mine drainage metagenome TaxID=410659 RepID=A0A1J5PIB5_9ZZZZ
MSGAGGVKNAVGKGNRQQRPDRAAIGFRGADRRRHLAIKFRLFGEQPPDNATDLRPGAARARAAEGRLRHQDMHHAVEHDQGRQGQTADRQPMREVGPGFWAGPPLHGQATVILLTNIAPKLELSPFVKVCSPSAWALTVPSFGRWKLS